MACPRGCNTYTLDLLSVLQNVILNYEYGRSHGAKHIQEQQLQTQHVQGTRQSAKATTETFTPKITNGRNSLSTWCWALGPVASEQMTLTEKAKLLDVKERGDKIN